MTTPKGREEDAFLPSIPLPPSSSSSSSLSTCETAVEKEIPGDLSGSTPNPTPAPAPSIASPEWNGSDAAMDTQDSDPIAEVVDGLVSPPESEAKEGDQGDLSRGEDESAATPMEEEEEEVVSLMETEDPVSSLASTSILLEGLPADTLHPPSPPTHLAQQQENEYEKESESELEEGKKSSAVDEIPTEDTSSVNLTQEVPSPPEEDSGIIQISSVASLTDLLSNDEDDDIVEMPQSDIGTDGRRGKENEGTLATDKELPTQSGTEEPGDNNGSSSSSFPRSNISTGSAASKKMGLKLASFASLGQNNIADTTPVRGHGNISGCKQCQKEIDKTVDQLLMWQTMQFCCETCLRNYQTDFNQCSSCSSTMSKTSVGRYCVRFGSDIKQFCSNVCLETSKEGRKVCCYCQKDISGGEGFLAQIGDKGQLNDFCLQSCLKRYEALHLGKPLEKEVLPCAVCSDLKPVEVQLFLKGSSVVKLCGNPCFSAFKFVNSLGTSYCDLCANPYDINASVQVIYYENHVKRFCSMSCQNVYIMKFRKIVPCQWCKVKKYNFDMVEKPSPKGVVFNTVYCSVNCLNLHGFKRKGDVTHVSSPPRNPPSWNPPKPTATSSSSTMPVIQSVSSLAPENPPPSLPFTAAPSQPPPPILDPATPEFKEGIIREHIVKCPDEVCNKATLTKPPYMSTKGVSCKPLSTSKSTQTDAPPPSCPLPLTVPFYLPVPLRMYASPYPVPVPLPLPIPVPVFMPIKRSSLEGVKKSVQKIHDKLPSDPFEAELLVMAEAIAGKASSLLKDSDTEEEEEYEDIDNLALEISLEINGDNNTDEESIGDSAAASSTSKDDPVEDWEKKIFHNEESAVEWARDHGLLRRTLNCPKCEANCKEVLKRGKRMWRCPKHECHSQFSIRRDSFFSNSKISMEKLLYLIFLWSLNTPVFSIAAQIKISKKVAVEWCNSMRQLCVQYFEDNPICLGGPGKVVEMNEFKFGKRKYDRGRLVEGKCVFGMVERDGGDCFFKVSEKKRTRDELWPLIMTTVLPESTLMYDDLTTHRKMEEHIGFTCIRVKHKKNYVDPITGAHTQTIESVWSQVKGFFRRLGSSSTPPRLFDSYLKQFSWVRKMKISERDVFQSAIELIAQKNPINV